MTKPPPRSERVNLRMTPDAKRMLQRAASLANKTMTGFLLESGMDAAFKTLADRRTYVVDDKQWAEFTTLLDSPPADNPGLRKLLARTPVWEA